jgi:outer membrane protein assembly factor BamA
MLLALAAVARAETPDSLPRVGTVEITGVAPADLGRLTAGLRLSPGDRLDSAAVALALERLARFHAGRGYPYCSARLAGVSLDGGRAGLRFEVERGQLVTLGNVIIQAKTTRPEVLQRLAGIAPGDLYSERALALAPRRLLASGLFRRVDSLRVTAGRTPATVDTHLAAGELPGSTLEAALGSGGQNGGQGIAGLVSLRMPNLFGTARSALVRWQRPGKDWQSLELAYREPWLAGSPVALEFAFSQQLRDSLFTQTEVNLGIGTELGVGLRAGIGATYGSASPGSDTYSGAESSSLWAVTGNAAWSSLLSPLNPSEGQRLEATGSIGRRRVEEIDRREVRARVSCEFYRALGHSSHVAALSGGAAIVVRGAGEPEDIPWHARIPVGGTLAGGVPVRGHAEESTRASRAGWLSLEYRLLTGEASRVFAFYDLALIEHGGGSGDAWRNSTLHGLGGGVLADTRLGLVEIAVGIDPERGPGGGRLHIRLAESF